MRSNYRNAFLIIGLIAKLELSSMSHINSEYIEYIEEVVYVFYIRVLYDSITRLHSKIPTFNGYRDSLVEIAFHRHAITMHKHIFKAAISQNSDFEIVISKTTSTPT